MTDHSKLADELEAVQCRADKFELALLAIKNGVADPAKFADEMLEAYGDGKRKCYAGATAGGGDPQECDWPCCDCDPLVSHIVEALAAL